MPASTRADRASIARPFSHLFLFTLLPASLLAAFLSTAPEAFANGPLAGVSRITGGWNHTCALTTTAGVKCWGNNVFGQLGDGTNAERRVPGPVSGLATGVIAVDAGDYHACAVIVGGGVKCWGNGINGQLGYGGFGNENAPVSVSGLTDAASISAGGSHTCAVTAGGAAKCWGGNVAGELGNGTQDTAYTPTGVSGLSSGVAAISAGFGHTCALTTGGGVKCWGDNTYGQLGNGSNAPSTTPVDVTGLTSGVLSVAAGGNHTCAVVVDGGVQCWGSGAQGQLGNNDNTNRTTPVYASGLFSGYAAVATGFAHSCALSQAGAVKCWGFNPDGQLGSNDTGTTLVPVNAVDGLLEPLAGQASLGMGIRHSCSVTAGGAAYCWGRNLNGQLGDARSGANRSFARLVLHPYANAVDLDRNGKGDIAWQNADGRVATWLMDGTAPAATGEILAAGTGFAVAHLADFNADGRTDILWSHPDGRAALWVMSGTTMLYGKQLLNAGSGWTAVHAADLGGDGQADIVWQHVDGSVAVWQMSGDFVLGGGGVLGPGTGWSVARVADFDGDGRGDLLWTHADGRAAIWLMNGHVPAASAQILNAGSGWSPAHARDLDGDGKADIVWQHADGSVAVWLMNGTTMGSGAGILGAGSGWSVAHVADFDDDGRGDLYWQHADGRAAIWLMNGLSPTATAQILNAGSGWSLRRTADLNGDRRADIIWQHTDGSVAVWTMSGTTMTGGTGILGPASGWSVSAASP